MSDTKYFEIQQVNSTGNGSSTTLALVINPEFEGGGIKATQVGVWDCDYVAVREKGEYFYRHIIPRKFMVCGNATCIERDHPFSD